MYLFISVARAGVTSMDTEFPERQITTIECVNKSGSKGVCHYNVYMPVGYHEPASKRKRYPCIFIAFPCGNPNIGFARQYCQKNRWLTVMLVESKNDPCGSMSYARNTLFDSAKKASRLTKRWRRGTIWL